MKTLICPYCGCSLVRLGVSKDKPATYSYGGPSTISVAGTALTNSRLTPSNTCNEQKIWLYARLAWRKNRQRRPSRSSMRGRKSPIVAVPIAETCS